MTDKRIRIILDNSQAKRGAKETDQALRDVGRSADRAQFSMNKLASAIIAAISIQKVVQYADAWNRVQNQLVRTTTSQENLAATTQTLLDVANQTRSSLEATVELYTSLSVSTESLGVSQERVIGVTETINNLFLESGKSAAESAGAIRQLGQALQSGTLRGDEFNSVAEGAPGILRAIELQTGKTRGELRELAAQGGITAELIVNSLESYSEAAQEAADKTSVTLDQSFTVAGNNLTSFIGQLDDATGASSSLASAIIDVSNYVSSPAFISGLIQAFETSVLTIDAASDAVGDFSNELSFAADVGRESLGIIGDAFKNLLPNLRAVVQILGVGLGQAVDRVTASIEFYGEAVRNAFSPSGIKEAFKAYQDELARINEVKDESIDLILQERAEIIKTAEASAKLRIEEANRRREERANREMPGVSSGRGMISETTSETGQKEIAQAQNITKQLQNELNLRLQIADIYRQKTLSSDETLYQQQLAAIAAREAEELARLQSKAVEDQIRRDEQFRQALENEKLQEEERLILREEQKAQQILAEQILEQERTAVLQEGIDARQRLREAEKQMALSTALSLGGQLMTLAQGQSKRAFELSKKTAIASALVSGGLAAVDAWKAGMSTGGPWAPAIAAAYTAASLLQTGNLIKNIRGQSFSGGGGSGSTAISAGGAMGGAGGGGGSQIPSTFNTPELQQQRRIIELRGVSPGDLLTGEQVASIFESDDSVIVAFESARENAQRRNVIGVTAR